MSDPRVEAIVAAVMNELNRGGATATAAAAAAAAPAAPPAPARGGQAPHRASGPALNRRVSSKLKISILGGGNGGLAMAGHLTLLGAENVRLFSFFDRELAAVRDKGGIEMIGNEVAGFAPIQHVTSSIDEAVKGADVIMIVSPAYTHNTYASLLAGLLTDGQTVILNPGRTGGALEFAQVLRRYACRARIYLGEAQTFIYAAEARAPGKVEILKEKFMLRAAALPATDNDHVIGLFQEMYPQVVAQRNVLETGIGNIGPINHVAPMLLNSTTIEKAAAGDSGLNFYRDMINPTICSLVMEKMDKQRMDIARAFGLEVWSTMDWYRDVYHVTGGSLYECYNNCTYIQGFSAPRHILSHNNIPDEIPSSLVPMSLLAKVVGVPTPSIDAIVNLACTMCEIDFWTVGRTLDKLGLAGKSKDEILEFVEGQPILGACSTCGVCRPLPQYR